MGFSVVYRVHSHFRGLALEDLGVVDTVEGVAADVQVGAEAVKLDHPDCCPTAGRRALAERPATRLPAREGPAKHQLRVRREGVQLRSQCATIR
ncbi:hypothetical protein SAMD00023353_2000290 [Rosellinia necatrix]|uniref:Uncharacterized protein n=1 Tax=Rosellinia necatrix TaxID=77044 RepID=A0A1S8A7L0_ROSNE|nr:hypothetical protein SAMD00023353_2000290 [Rosellinia necatrix]